VCRRAKHNDFEVLVRWENDPQTGKEYEDSWIPLSDCNKTVQDHWRGTRIIKRSSGDVSWKRVVPHLKSIIRKYEERGEDSKLERLKPLLEGVPAQRTSTVIGEQASASGCPAD